METVGDFALGAFRGYNLVIREYGNGVLYPLMLWLALVTGLFMGRAYFADRINWRSERGISYACLFMWFFVGEGCRALAAWLPLDAAREGRKLPTGVEDFASALFTIGVVVLVAVSIRAIYLFAEPGFRARSIFLAGGFTGSLIAIAEYLT